jgi:hypothetical protein
MQAGKLKLKIEFTNPFFDYNSYLNSYKIMRLPLDRKIIMDIMAANDEKVRRAQEKKALKEAKEKELEEKGEV